MTEPLRIGWCGLVKDGDKWRAITSPENRHSIALADALGTDEATHVGYWNGDQWEEVEPVVD
jgi:endonuclease YncB( thermonuclease family)